MVADHVLLHAVAVDDFLDLRQHLLPGNNNGKLVSQACRNVHGGFQQANHRDIDRFPRLAQRRVAGATDDRRVGPFPLRFDNGIDNFRIVQHFQVA